MTDEGHRYCDVLHHRSDGCDIIVWFAISLQDHPVILNPQIFKALIAVDGETWNRSTQEMTFCSRALKNPLFDLLRASVPSLETKPQDP